MAINLLSDAEDASVDSQKCKAALIYVLLNGTPPFPNKIEIDKVRDFLNSEGIPVDICEVAKVKELNLEHRLPRCLQPAFSPMLDILRIIPDGELVLDVAKGQDGAGSVRCRSCYEVVFMRCGIEPSLDRNMKDILWLSPPSERSGRLRGYYCTVFGESSKPVLFKANLSDLSAILSDAVKVLRYIHGCGYVHRDISVGNMYLFEGRGLLGDLEYAKFELDDLRQELRTGALNFMAAEATRRTYYFDTKDTVDLEKAMKSQILRKVKGIAARTDEPTNDNPTFFHNDLHDMESLWWIAIWELFFHYDKSQSEVNEEMIAARQTASYKLFPRYLTTEHRRNFFRSPNAFYKLLAWLDESLADVKDQLGFLRLHLHNRYQDFERTFPKYTFAAFQGVQATFQEHFEYCVSFASGIELVPFKTTGLRGTNANTGDGGRPKQMPPTVPTPPVVPEQSTAQAPAPEAPSEPSMATPGSAAVPSGSPISSSLGKRKAIDDLTPRPQLTRPIHIIECQRQP